MGIDILGLSNTALGGIGVTSGGLGAGAPADPELDFVVCLEAPIRTHAALTAPVRKGAALTAPVRRNVLLSAPVRGNACLSAPVRTNVCLSAPLVDSCEDD